LEEGESFELVEPKCLNRKSCEHQRPRATFSALIATPPFASCSISEASFSLYTMLRTAAVRALRAAAAPRLRQTTSFRSQTFHPIIRSSQFAPSIVLPSIRCYSAPSGLSKEEVQGRIMDLLKNFDKVRCQGKCQPRSSD
jgi:hypothetical protein